MRKLLFIVGFISEGTVFGQISFEHHYENYDTRRIVLENSGEKYVEQDIENKQINLFNPDHSLWKTIDLVLPENATANEFYHVSEKVVNSDDLLEIGYSYTYSNNVDTVVECVVMNENGVILLTVPDEMYYRVDELEGESSKLVFINPMNQISGESKVYALPDFELEHVYNNGFAGTLELEISGKKYYIYDQLDHQVILYNIDHTIWKVINIQIAPNAEMVDVFHFSENKINADSNVEIGYSYFVNTNGNYYATCILINELEENLLTMPGMCFFNVDEMVGLPTKLIAHSGTSSMSKVYSLPDFDLEYTCANDFLRKRFQLEGAGIKHYYLDVINQSIEILNEDYSYWKSVHLPSLNSTSFSTTGEEDQILITQNKLNEDDELEIGYTYVTFENGQIANEGKIVNESGDVLGTFPNAEKIKLSEIINCETKLIVYNILMNNNVFSNTVDVYSIGTSTNNLFMLTNQQISSEIYPNPSHSYFIVKNVDFDQLSIYDLDGKEIMIFINNIPKEIDVSSMNSGIYFVECKKEDKIVSRSKLIVN